MTKKIKILLFAFLLAGLFFYIQFYDRFTFDGLIQEKEKLLSLHQSQPLFFSFAFLLFYILYATFSFPGAVLLTLTAGFVFQFVLGSLIVVVASVTGATFCFLISRYFLKDYVQRNFQKKFSVINENFKKDGFFYLLSLRLIPAVPFFMVNVFMGLTSISVKQYCLGTFLGMLPAILVYVNAGQQLATLESLSDIVSFPILFSFLLLGALPWLFKLALSFFSPSFKKDSHKDSLRKALQISKEEKAVFVFDIDSTLLCMKYRTQAIIDQALKEEFIVKDFSQHLEVLSQIKVTERDWSVAEILSRYHLKDTNLIKKMESYWRKQFFVDTHLCLDRPYEGAVDFVNQLKLNSSVYYLTARNEEILRTATLKSLKDLGFPLEDSSQLIMKKRRPEKRDTEYKTEQLRLLSKKFDTVCFFENEPVILNAVSQSLPHVHLFWMDSTHSRREKATSQAHVLSFDYSL